MVRRTTKNKASKFGDYTLYKKNVKLRGGRKQELYFYSKRVPRGAKATSMPDGYKMGLNKRTGLPFRMKK